MSELAFTIIDARVEPYAVIPTLLFRLQITESSGERIHAIALRCQIQVEPRQRRYSHHAQPNACPRCGPRVRLLDFQGRESAEPDAVFGAAQLLSQGAILAVKGLGGYHLACNALDHDAVRRLRARKHREDKPFALMARDLNAVRKFCIVALEDERLLSSLQRPIVLLRKHAPGSDGYRRSPTRRNRTP